jgi:hypothetical protein
VRCRGRELRASTSRTLAPRRVAAPTPGTVDDFLLCRQADIGARAPDIHANPPRGSELARIREACCGRRARVSEPVGAHADDDGAQCEMCASRGAVGRAMSGAVVVPRRSDATASALAARSHATSMQATGNAIN